LEKTSREGESVKSLFDEKEAREFVAKSGHIFPELALRVYTSRLLGRDPSLVLHGGGNTSVKLWMKNLVGEDLEVIFVKGSGADLATIDPSGFVGLELEPLRKLQKLENLSEGEMENQLKIHKILHSAPDPSVEVLLHAFLPPRFIDHTHADSVLVLTNQKRGIDLIQEALGPQVAVLPYITPGIQLAKAAREVYEKNPNLEGIVVAGHGLFTFGEDARTAYERMIQYVDQAEKAVEEAVRKSEENKDNAIVSVKKVMARFKITYVTAASRLDSLESAGLIITKKQGKIRALFITEKGKKLYNKRKTA